MCTVVVAVLTLCKIIQLPFENQEFKLRFYELVFFSFQAVPLKRTADAHVGYFYLFIYFNS